MPRRKSPDFTIEMRQAISAARLTRPEVAELIGVRLNTLDKWLAPGLDNPTPRWALDLFRLKVERRKERG
jgi:hypothetical protein